MFSKEQSAEVLWVTAQEKSMVVQVALLDQRNIILLRQCEKLIERK